VKKKKRTRRQFAATLIESLMIVFDESYFRSKSGESETELIIEHDIIAANNDEPEPIASCHRKAIRSAVAAVAQGVPFELARSYMLFKLNERADELVRETGEA
jgi:hypothetical protein